jgi:hypothetical protein
VYFTRPNDYYLPSFRLEEGGGSAPCEVDPKHTRDVVIGPRYTNLGVECVSGDGGQRQILRIKGRGVSTL